VAWVFFTVPEMKGFSIEQLDFLYDNQVPTWKFKKYRFDSETAVVLDGEAASVEESDVGDKGPVIVAAKNTPGADYD
jgi:SP family sugar:H+ symporter-like MFS transporter